MNLAFADSYLSAQDKLDANTLKAVRDAVKKLRTGGPEQVGLHALEACDFQSFAVNQNAFRIIAHVEGDNVVLVHVGPHDQAYKWARRHKVSQIGATIRVRRLTVVDADDDGKPPTASSSNHVPSSSAPGPLESLRDRELARFDVTPGFSSILRQLPDEDAVVEVAEHLKPALGEALVELLTDPDAIDVAHRVYVQRRASASPAVSLEAALRDPRNAHRFWVPPPGEEALARALDGDFEAWRVFLHPSQRRLVEIDARGPVKVTGGPGTGKTVVALHRARHLAERIFVEDPRPILVTAFSDALVRGMKASFQQLCDDAPQLVERVHFRTATGVALDLLKAAGAPRRFATEADLDSLWEEALREDTMGYDAAFYRLERRDVLARHGAWDSDSYFKAPREGRRVRFDRKKRKAAWAVLEAFQSRLQASGAGDDIELARSARHALADSPFAAVVVDELQDMAPESLRLLAALGAGPDGAPRPNALFLAGDGYQRIFRHPVPLSAAGIDVRGRAHHLRLNYRTTEGIRAAAVKVIEGLELDTLDAASDASDGDGTPGYRRYRSIRPGPPPEQPEPFASHDALATWVASEAERRPLLVLVRTNAELDALHAALGPLGVGVRRVEEEGASDARVRLATMHRAKGLESPGVVIVQTRGRRPPDVESDDEWQRRSRALDYVAMTRARDWCALAKVEKS